MLCQDADIVPRRFHISSGLKTASLRVARASRNYQQVDGSQFHFRIMLNGNWQRATIPIASFPSEVEAMSILGELDGECEREGRFIRVHAAYEAAVKDRDVRLSAIRHALVHPIVRLTRPDVRSALEYAFGGEQIDLTLHAHQKIYYKALVDMLRQIDAVLYETFTSRRNEVNLAADA